MRRVTKAKVYISYTWRADNRDDPNDRPKEGVLKLADRLREAGLDCRIDQYFLNALHGFRPPQSRPGDKLEPWLMWVEQQIKEADSVLLVCTLQYSANVSDSPLGELTWEVWQSMSDDWKVGFQQLQLAEPTENRGKIPYTWWDWHFMIKELESGSAQPEKFIPVGFGSYSSRSRYIPAFIKGASYYNLESTDEFEALVRVIKMQFRQRHPREGIFISYSHRDEQWLNLLLQHIAYLKQQGVEIWTDREIEPGDQWREEIDNALATARVAVLLVTPSFLASPFIQNNELPEMLRAAKSEGLVIFWIAVEPSSYDQYEIRDFQAAHPASEPLSSLKGAKRGQALVTIASKLAKALGMSKPQ